MAVRAKVIGSSFVTNLADYIADPQHGGLLSNMQLDPDFATVEVSGVRGLRVHKLPTFKPDLETNTPDLVIMHCGGNDLAKRDSLSVAVEMHDFASYLVEDLHVDKVVMLSTLKRFSVRSDGCLKYGIPENVFHAKAFDLNLRLSHLFDNNHMYFWDLRTLQGEQTCWTGLAEDGVHLNEVGMKKYYREIRGAIIESAEEIHGTPYAYWL